jgi:2-phospho-L-lactate/phosphoenolpyruvate guanylyltransferase
MVSRLLHMDAALLPVKRLDRAKGRLAGHFDAHQRAAIARALFEDALALCAAADFLRWWVVSDDPQVLAEAGRRGLETVRDPGVGLNRALEDGIAEATSQGAATVTIVPADVPLAWRGDLEDLLDTGATSDVVVVPSRTDGGTNALYLSPPGLIAPQFGPGSLKAHVDIAERLKLRCAILSLPRLELDIDTLEDVDSFLAARRPAPTHAATVLERLRPLASAP